MLYRLPLLFLLFFLSGCSSPKPPEGVITKDKMIDVMVDFQIVEASILQKQNYQQDVRFYTNYYYDSILKKHSISRNDFKRSIDWYKNDTREMDAMYAEVLSRLSAMQPGKKK